MAGRQSALGLQAGSIVRKIIGSIAGPGALATGFFRNQRRRANGLGRRSHRSKYARPSSRRLSRSCLRVQIDAPANKGLPVSALYDYCKCYSNGMADKLSDDEVRSLEATGDEKKYNEALHDRAMVVIKQCQEATSKSLLKSN